MKQSRYKSTLSDEPIVTVTVKLSREDIVVERGIAVLMGLYRPQRDYRRLRDGEEIRFGEGGEVPTVIRREGEYLVCENTQYVRPRPNGASPRPGHEWAMYFLTKHFDFAD